MSTYIQGYKVNENVVDGILEMMNDQPPIDRLHYRDIAFEAVLNPEGKSRMIQKLYKDIISKSNIDVGKIPLSKGDITRYEHYNMITSSIDILNNLLDSSKVEELALTNKLHDMIVTCRADFEFGFKFDVEFVKLMYNTMVMTLHQMINLCIMAYTNYLKEVKQIEFNFKSIKRSDLIVIKSTRDFLKSYEKGEWTKLMLHFKKNKSAMIQEKEAVDAPATEGPFSSQFFSKKIDNGTAFQFTKAGEGLVIAVIIIGFMIILRALIYFFYAGSARFNDWIKGQSELLTLNIANDKDQTDKSLTRQNNMKNLLDRISNFIEVKILKTEVEARKQLKESNKENFSTQELQGAASATDIELF